MGWLKPFNLQVLDRNIDEYTKGWDDNTDLNIIANDLIEVNLLAGMLLEEIKVLITYILDLQFFGILNKEQLLNFFKKDKKQFIKINILSIDL